MANKICFSLKEQQKEQTLTLLFTIDSNLLNKLFFSL